MLYYLYTFVHTAVQQLLPPENLQLVEQSIDPTTQSIRMMVKWDPVEVEPSSDITGYSVFVDGELFCTVPGIKTNHMELTGLNPKVSRKFID